MDRYLPGAGRIAHRQPPALTGAPAGTRIAFRADGSREINPVARHFYGAGTDQALDVAGPMW